MSYLNLKKTLSTCFHFVIQIVTENVYVHAITVYISTVIYYIYYIIKRLPNQWS